MKISDILMFNRYYSRKENQLLLEFVDLTDHQIRINPLYSWKSEANSMNVCWDVRCKAGNPPAKSEQSD